MIDIQSVRMPHDVDEISSTGLLRSENNPTDLFTKVKENYVLQNIILHSC